MVWLVRNEIMRSKTLVVDTVDTHDANAKESARISFVGQIREPRKRTARAKGTVGRPRLATTHRRRP